MKKVLRGIVLCLLCALLAGVLGGCGMFRSIESLYALPALPEEYSRLQSSIQAVMDEMQAEFTTISYGNYTSTIQLLDLNSDGEQETAAVFLRVPSAAEKPLRVCLFRQEEDGEYRLTHTLQGEGSSIHSVTYEDLTGDRELEMLGRYEENAYFWRMMKVAGHQEVHLYELDGYDHGAMAAPAFHILKNYIRSRQDKP